MTLLRWLLLLPACLSVWLLVVVLAMWTHGHVTLWLCPPDMMVSGMCEDMAIQERIDLTYAVFSPVSAAALVATAYLLAPKNKRKTSLITLLLGSVITIAFFWGSLSLIASTITGGALTHALLCHRKNIPPTNVQA